MAFFKFSKIKFDVMKYILIMLASFSFTNIFSQNAEIEGVFNDLNVKRTLFISRPLLTHEFEKIENEKEIIIDNGKFKFELTIQYPEIMYLTSFVNDTFEFKQPIFLKEGYKIFILYNSKNKKIEYIVKGIGAEDNQPLNLTNSIDFNKYFNDTLPDIIQHDLVNESNKRYKELQDYIVKLNPSADFIKSWNYELQYLPISIYYIFSKQRIIYIREAFTRNKKIWDDVFNKMLVNAPLMNEDAFNSPRYQLFLKMILVFNKPHILASEVDKSEFIKNWYNSISDTASRSFYNDQDNIPNQKVIEKYFTGKVKEYLYGHLFTMALESGKVSNVDSIYSDFCKQYPFSNYKKIFDKPISRVFEHSNITINKKIVFESNTIKTWEEIINLFKGKIVLLDMWGTWCRPCRESIKNHDVAIKTAFKNKGLEYLYIANKDEKYIKIWKSLINFFELEGHHLLANDELTAVINKKIKLKGYPTYVIIHKDGTFEIINASLDTPAEKKIFFTQVENALK